MVLPDLSPDIGVKGASNTALTGTAIVRLARTVEHTQSPLCSKRFLKGWPAAAAYYLDDSSIPASKLRGIARRMLNTVARCLKIQYEPETLQCVANSALVMLERVYRQSSMKKSVDDLRTCLLIAAQAVIDDEIPVDDGVAKAFGFGSGDVLHAWHSHILSSLDYRLMVGAREYTDFKLGVQSLIPPPTWTSNAERVAPRQGMAVGWGTSDRLR
jgi:hypothetical protein